MDIDKNMTITEKNLPYPSVINLGMKITKIIYS